MRPTYSAAANRPKLIFYIDRRLLSLSVILSTLILWGNTIFGLVVLVVSVLASYWLTNKDPRYLSIFPKLIGQTLKPILDPLKRKRFRVIIQS